MHLNAWVVKGSQQAIEQIINIINPEGSIALLGVSELPIQVNTRMVLEKGLTIIGSSRSGLKDFEKLLNCIVNILKFLIN